tara:strand:+ start:321 stop:473 length:153 start_codon:yes stop_codon:yes gene_type:complete
MGMPQLKLSKHVMGKGYTIHPVFIKLVNNTKNNNNKNKEKNLLKIKKPIV